MHRSLKFWSKEEGFIIILSMEIKQRRSDQLHGPGYRAADLPLCFHIIKYAKSRLSHNVADVDNTR